MNTKNIVIIVPLLISLVALLGCVSGPRAPPVPGGLVTPWGVLSGTDAPGEDLECIGRPGGMVRGYYEKSEYGDGSFDVTIVYYSEGDSFESVKSAMTQKISSCGWSLESSSTSGVSLPGMNALSACQAEYSKGDDSLSLVVALVKSGDREYTIVNLELSHYPAGTEESESPEPGVQESESQDYSGSGAPEPVTPTGEAATWDEEVRPVLESVYDTVVLFEYGTYPGVYLKYWVPRETTPSDASLLAQEFTSRGYELVGVSTGVEAPEAYVNLERDDKIVSVTLYPGGDYVEVLVLSG